MTYNVFSGTINPTQSQSQVSCKLVTVLTRPTKLADETPGSWYWVQS